MRKNLFLAMGLLFCCFNLLIAQENTSTTEGDEFGSNSVWVNTEYPVVLQHLVSNKVVLVVITDEHCVEGQYFIDQLQNSLLRVPAVQLLQVMPAGEKPISRSHLVQYIQQHKLNHPIGIVADLKGFQSANITQLPYFLLYEKTTTPTVVGAGHVGFELINSRIKTLNNDKNLFATCNNAQVKPFIDPAWYANPIIECPTYIADQQGGKGFFLNDAAHHRILGFDDTGTMALQIGSTTPGFSDNNMYGCSLNHPHGMVYHNNKLYIADTYNQRVRVVDFITEKTTTLLGNGYTTWKEEETIDANHQPLGLPVAVAFMGNSLYVASASTNQIFEVDPEDGQAKVFCKLPVNNKTLYPSAPASLKSTGDELYITMNNGELYVADKKGKLTRLGEEVKEHFVSAMEFNGGVIAISEEGHVWFQEKDKWRTLGEAKEKGKHTMMLNHPTDLMIRNGDLYLTDTDNHLVKNIGSSTDKMAMNYWFKVTRDLVGFEPAHTYGELIGMDSIYFKGQDIKVKVLMDLHGFKMVPDGQNEILLNDLTGQIKIPSETITKEEFTFTIQKDFPDADIYIELYLTLEHPENPGVYIVKRSYLDFPVIHDEKEADPIQEQIYTPLLLPY
ncbi:MAG: hypothetical protein K1X54_07840 [Flavobacteriales bacterium]|nr:hypothetical protein [Flavobacteriales bacterium]